jgi:hypothetical protein
LVLTCKTNDPSSTAITLCLFYLTMKVAVVFTSLLVGASAFGM